MAAYLGYAPKFYEYRFFESNEKAEQELYISIEAVFKNDPETKARLLGAARNAFVAFNESRIDDGYSFLKEINDECN